MTRGQRHRFRAPATTEPVHVRWAGQGATDRVEPQPAAHRLQQARRKHNTPQRPKFPVPSRNRPSANYRPLYLALWVRTGVGLTEHTSHLSSRLRCDVPVCRLLNGFDLGSAPSPGHDAGGLSLALADVGIPNKLVQSQCCAAGTSAYALHQSTLFKLGHQTNQCTSGPRGANGAQGAGAASMSKLVRIRHTYEDERQTTLSFPHVDCLDNEMLG
ncbi:uncharacterized protein CLUP02_04019 [Colletotrichum lupini]|uniref:Uncharacterized protein n=1 Tax=Colletotrichum lupini TaxID=145971 RepID=A0A9Q8SLB7_9PEZI|nr:uncharacterized protein CLUP02_04019 [Colletotrichum lupini]UQC78542.1 hypothetical protein CLUP02_04019 [Colletotrichum lupini]